MNSPHVQDSTAADAISELRQRVEQLEACFAETCNKADYFETAEAKRFVQSLTRQIFPGDVRIEDSADPEIPGARYLVVFATAAGSGDETRRKCREWHQQLSILSPPLRRLFRLSVDVS